MKLKYTLTAFAVALAALAQPTLADSIFTQNEKGEVTHVHGIPLPPIQTFEEAKAQAQNEIAAKKAREAEQPEQLATRHSSPDTPPQEVFFTGKPYLEETGQYLFLFRHYDSELARWTTADPSGFPDGANNVTYRPTPTSQLDLWGLVSVTVTGTPTSSVSGSPLGIQVLQAPKKIADIQAESKVKWTINGNVDGWIIQHVKFQASVYNKSDNSLHDDFSLEYWEGWQLVGGNIYIGSKNTGGTNVHGSDTFRTKKYSTSTYGEFSITGYVGFYQSYDLQIPPWGYSIAAAGALPTITSQPAGWSTSGGHDHTLKMVWE